MAVPPRRANRDELSREGGRLAGRDAPRPGSVRRPRPGQVSSESTHGCAELENPPSRQLFASEKEKASDGGARRRSAAPRPAAFTGTHQPSPAFTACTPFTAAHDCSQDIDREWVAFALARRRRV